MPKELARTLRKRLTDAEIRLWVNLRHMRQQGLAFRRQSPIGRFIVDFECRRAKLIVELDGNQHDQTSTKAYDAERTAWLTTQGYEVLRFSNDNMLRSTDVIVDHIISVAKERAKALRR
jgi:very-short-patch-repair endonuclease